MAVVRVQAKGVRLGSAELLVAHPPAAAADRDQDALFAARATLKRAYAMRGAAQLQVDQIRALIGRLEAERQSRA